METKVMVVEEEAVFAIRRVILTAIVMHEASYEHPPDGGDSPGEYTMTMEECVIEACKLRGVHHLLAPLVWLALAGTHNDARAWAEGEYDSSFTENGKFVDEPVVGENDEPSCVESTQSGDNR